MPLCVTALTTLILGSLHMALTLRVIAHRRAHHVVFGDNGDKALMKKIRGQANSSEQLPIALITLGFAEYLLPGIWIWGVAVGLIIGRFMHAAYFAIDGLPWQMRFWGMFLSIFSVIGALSILAIGLLL